MAILRRVEASARPHLNVEVRHDLPGHEAGRILHGGTCPLRGQVQRGGVRGPFCTSGCVGPTPPIYIESTHEGLVLAVETDRATVWDFLTKKPAFITLEPDSIFPMQATVDATPDLVALYDEWKAWRSLEVELKQDAIRRAEEEKKSAKAKVEAERLAKLEAARLAEEAKEAARQRSKESRIRAGVKLRIVADPPGFEEANRKLKPRNRTPSLVGLTVHCCDPGYDAYVFVRLPDGTTARLLRSLVRVILKDGSLGDADLSPGMGRGPVLSDD